MPCCRPLRLISVGAEERSGRLLLHLSEVARRHLVNSDVPFEEQITGLLDVMEPKLGALKEILSLPGIEGELFLGFGSGNGQGGAIFSPELLRRVADCGLSLGLDLYPPGGDENEAE